jgi:Ca2+-binding EF-hand superfamily protein
MKRLMLCSSTVASAVGCFMLSTSALAGDTPHKAHAVPASADAELQMMDQDKDGKVSKMEHASGAKAMFNSMDADKSGIVTVAEMDAAQKMTTKTGETPPGKISSAEKLKVVDTDGDGSLTEEEHSLGAEKMFGRMDTDKDGRLTKAELEAGHKMMLSAK